jgi:uncharacterized protein YegL
MNVYILLDRSGSMESMWKESIHSINAYVKELDPDTYVHMAVFDYDYNVVRNGLASEWVPLDSKEIAPRGSTALFDSAARIIHRAIDDAAERTLIVVMTDGYENVSKHYKKEDVKSLSNIIDGKKWELIFIGVNFDKVGDVAQEQFGRASNKFNNISAGNMQEYMTKGLATSSRAYTATGQAVNITDEDRAWAVRGSFDRGSLNNGVSNVLTTGLDVGSAPASVIKSKEVK